MRCLIYEILSKERPNEKALRTFIEFRQVESAMEAAEELNGRYSEGRIVEASFYRVDKFNRYEQESNQ